jgi:hypothetical protein
MKTQFTPGPWEILNSITGRNDLYIWSSIVPDAEVSRAIASVHPDSGGSQKDNARLIAAAPELLKALQAIEFAGTVGPQNPFHMTRAEMVRRARAAIAKATKQS